MSEVQTKRKVQVYACGGGGTNMGHRLESMRAEQEIGYAELSIMYVDTSRSNMPADISHKNVHLVKNVNGSLKDGSGAIRSENNEDIAAAIPEILLAHPPGDLNIIISTLAGGTGSVAAPLLARELTTNKRLPTIVIGVGDTSTLVHTRNSLRTMQSYEAIAQDGDAPIAMYYLQNSAEMTRAEIDRRVKNLVSALSALFSGENRELDSKDLYNWLFFNNPKITSFQPHLTSIEHLIGDEVVDRESLSDLGNVIAVATLAADGAHTAFPIRPDYQTVGFFGQDVNPKFTEIGPHHFVLSDGKIHAVIDDLETTLKDMEQRTNARQDRRRILDAGTRADKSGLIL